MFHFKLRIQRDFKFNTCSVRKFSKKHPQSRIKTDSEFPTKKPTSEMH